MPEVKKYPLISVALTVQQKQQQQEYLTNVVPYIPLMKEKQTTTKDLVTNEKLK